MFQVFLRLVKKWSFYKVNRANGWILNRLSVSSKFYMDYIILHIYTKFYSFDTLHIDTCLTRQFQIFHLNSTYSFELEHTCIQACDHMIFESSNLFETYSYSYYHFSESFNKNSGMIFWKRHISVNISHRSIIYDFKF